MMNKREDKYEKCPFFGKCGGCSTDIPYSLQLRQKEEQIKDLLSYYGKVWPIIGSKRPLYYRNKVNWEYTVDKKGKQYNGMYEAGGHYVVPVENCMLNDKCAQSIITDINSYFDNEHIPYYNEFKNEGFLRHVLIRRSKKNDMTMVVLVTGMWTFPHKERFIEYITTKHPDIVTIVQNRNKEHTSMILSDEPERILYGNGYIEDSICGLTFRISAKSFAQVNAFQVDELYSVAMDMAYLKGNESVIDAYCGTGTIGLIAASNGAGSVLGIENNPDAVEDAVVNAKLNNIDSAHFVCSDASEYLKQMARENKSADIVFLDPPRTGTDERFLSSVFKLSPKKIIYISCNPFTLNRDLRYIVRFSDYKVKAIQPIDMFPFSSHIETVALLSKVKE